MTGSGSSDTGLAAVGGRRMAQWWPHPLRIKDRRTLIDALMVVPTGAAVARFAVLMFLSSLVAAIGLLQNSAAVVIGAMMIAPLMSPIMGVAASLVMGWGRRLLQGLALVLVSAIGAVGVGWAFATLLASTGVGLPAEVVARCSPDIRDLLVALGAGAAGAFATVHKEISVALPGVAVAVAVVPPLAAVGVLLGRGQPDLARGAALLFVTNLVGIILMAALVFLVSGLVPLRTFRERRPQILVSLAAAAAAAVAVALILVPRFVALTGHARDLETATQTITNMLGAGNTLGRITTTGDTVRAEIIGPTHPPSVQDVAAKLSNALGRPVTVQLGWIPVETPQEQKPKTPPPPLSALAPAVETWLTEQSLTLKGLSFEAGTLVVATAGPRPPESSAKLAARLKDLFGQEIPISLGWTSAPEANGPTDDETALAAARSTATSWAASRPDTAVLGVTGSAREVTVTLIGREAPDVVELEADLRTTLPQAMITIQWVSGGLLVSAIPTPTPTATPAPTTPPR
ncbi:DUF389 domain-containing protein [Mycobacterium sp. CVI_P3]|uniref:DUF389 domain-containing protein n=1 Tax=Mycobacterium pinniadriaticum TaxID=2994102 RepID=A0ABT3SP43_9MYCO|nr:DUF389 domain-containing protein [Mycobacterium pinniadriaticum]MCX2934500.1 DUF389 domain-containing protein [Mycobacterium pinniadriaticum]MCX2940914.1 DUF389 domain-containing protein [Mycobacterium pinniadriaticum]